MMSSWSTAACRWTLCLGMAMVCACGDDNASAGPDTASVTPARTASLRVLPAKALTGLCEELLPKLRSASTPAHQCTQQGVTTSNSEADCAVAKKNCVDAAVYDDWAKAECANLVIDARMLPKFDCTTRVSEVVACFDSVATWLNGLTCQAAGGTAAASSPPPCLAELENGACKFTIDPLLKNLDFRALKPSAPLSALTDETMAELCEALLPKIRLANTPEHQCTQQAVLASNSEADCTVAKKSCVDAAAHDDWTKAECADLASDAGTPPKFDCSTKVSEVIACYDSVTTWLSALTCQAAGGAGGAGGTGAVSSPPPCLADLENGACKFTIEPLLKNLDFRAPKATSNPDEFSCRDGQELIAYDLGSGAECNMCATGSASGCCDSFVQCLQDTACECFLNCADDDSNVCYKKCKITDDPPAFADHVQCLRDHCKQTCTLLQ